MKTVIAVYAAVLMFGGTLGLSLVLAAPVPRLAKQENPQGLLEKKLHGEWIGDPCMGDWTFGADGTFALKNYSPGGNKFTGVWKVRWDALPPTLFLTFKTSNAPLHFKVGQTWEVKLVQLDDKTFAYKRPEDTDKPVRCRRATK